MFIILYVYIFKKRFAFLRFSKKRLMSPSCSRSRRFHRLSSVISRRLSACPRFYFISSAEIPRALISEYPRIS